MSELLTTKWSDKKSAAIRAGVPPGVFGTDNLGSKYDELFSNIKVFSMGMKATQNEKGMKALEKLVKDIKTQAKDVESIAAKYVENLEKAQGKTEGPAYKALSEARAIAMQMKTSSQKVRNFVSADNKKIAEEFEIIRRDSSR